MIDIKTINRNNIFEENTINGLKEAVNLIVIRDDVKSANLYRRQVIKIIEGVSDYPKNIDMFLAKLSWISFSLLTDQEMFNLIKNHLVTGLSLPIVVIDKFKLWFMALPFVKKETIKQKAAEILEENEAIITRKNGLFTGPLSQKQTLANWLKEFRIEIFSKPPDQVSLAMAKYFSTNKNFIQLEENCQKMLKIFFDLYDYLKTSSLLPGGYDQDYIISWPDGKTSLLDNGKLIDIPVTKRQTVLSKTETVSLKPQRAVVGQLVDKSGNIQQIQKAYAGDPAEEKAIADLQNKLTGQNAIQSLFEAINDQDKKKTIAILRLLAKEKSLEKIVAASGQLHSMFLGFLQGQYGQPFLEKFKQNPQSPVYIQLFLQYILQEKLGLADGESARQAIHLANIYSQTGDDRYLKMAYADEQTGTFKWKEIEKQVN